MSRDINRNIINPAIHYGKLVIKGLFLLFLLLLAPTVPAQQLDVQTIEYEVRIRDVVEGLDDLWFKNNIEGSSRMPWILALLDSAKNGSLPVYDINDINRRLSEDEVDAIFFTRGTEAVTTDLITGDGTFPMTYIPSEPRFWTQDCAVLRFREEWQWSDQNGWKKRITSFALVVETTEGVVEPLDTFALFWIKSAVGTYQEKTITPFIEYTVLFPKDDPKLPKVYPTLNAWYQNLLASIEQGKITAYDQDFNNRMGIGKTLPWAELSQWLENLKKNIENPEKQSTFAGIRFREHWDWHPDKGLTKTIIAIAPMVAVYDEQGVSKGNIPLFWLQF